MNAIERPYELEGIEAFEEYTDVVNSTILDITGGNETETAIFWTKMMAYSDEKGSAPSLTNPDWTYSGAAFFAVTVMTTIGYGTFAPSTDGGKVFTIFYALFSIPCFLYTLAVVSELIKNVGKKISFAFTNRFLINPHADVNSIDSKKKQRMAFLGISAFNFILILAFAEAFRTVYDDWSYLDSIYFNVITLTTVGLGDYAPDPQTDDEREMVGFIFFIVIGLAAVGSLLAVIQDSIQSAAELLAKEKKQEDEPGQPHARKRTANKFQAAGNIRKNLQIKADADRAASQLQRRVSGGKQ
eukprot:CAMPEP_0194576706 /NCGR_PEP_ID=MMETSP0292-20121207/11741_1 /TAXON_ID=39354 /ORGANISM="Heterosigma akashiwo, Strain CCMP2393" /LENGTH=298 /DNA_ID=CAMNT_0039428863 /DNA_START=210 /DNA_END=1106 /DNA_ORIENTATION=+